MEATAWGPLTAKMLLYVGALMAVGRGSVAFLDPEWKAGARSVFDTAVPRTVARIGAIALMAAPLLLLQLQLDALEMTRADIPVLLADTAWGHGWSQLTMACLLASVALVLPVARATSLLLLVASLGLAAALGGLGHAAADEQWPIGARVLDAMHVAAMGAWIGGLLTTLLITRVPAFALRDAAWRTFSRTATIMAPVTVLTGVGSGARLLLGMPPAMIVSSDYGFLLLVKTVLVIVVLVIGARQRSRIARGAAPVNRTMWVEIGVATFVLWVTAVLTGTAPPGE
jgi:putative copper export protein